MGAAWSSRTLIPAVPSPLHGAAHTDSSSEHSLEKQNQHQAELLPLWGGEGSFQQRAGALVSAWGW